MKCDAEWISVFLSDQLVNVSQCHTDDMLYLHAQTAAVLHSSTPPLTAG